MTDGGWYFWAIVGSCLVLGVVSMVLERNPHTFVRAFERRREVRRDGATLLGIAALCVIIVICWLATTGK